MDQNAFSQCVSYIKKIYCIKSVYLSVFDKTKNENFWEVGH